MTQLRANSCDFFQRVAGLLQHKRNIPAGLTEQQRVPCWHAAVAIDRQSHAIAHGFPHLAHHLDINLHLAAANFDLQAGIPLVRFVSRNARDVVGFAHTGSVVRGHAVCDGTAK